MKILSFGTSFIVPENIVYARTKGNHLLLWFDAPFVEENALELTGIQAEAVGRYLRLYNCQQFTDLLEQLKNEQPERTAKPSGGNQSDDPRQQAQHGNAGTTGQLKQPPKRNKK